MALRQLTEVAALARAVSDPSSPAYDAHLGDAAAPATKVRLYRTAAGLGLTASRGYDTATGLGSPGERFFRR